jgi:hypothetical protein
MSVPSADPATVSGTQTTDSLSSTSGTGEGIHLDAWSRFASQVGGAGRDGLHGAFGSNGTLGFAGQRHDLGADTGASHGAGDGLMAKLALLTQYAASSFAKPGAISGGTLVQDASAAALAPTLTKPQQAALV